MIRFVAASQLLALQPSSAAACLTDIGIVRPGLAVIVQRDPI
jgi:hypothetical protein